MTRYNQNRPQFKSGDYLAWSGTGFISDGIKLRTEVWRPQYENKCDINVSHSSLLLRLPLYEGLDERIWTIEAMNDGTVLHILSKDLSAYRGKVYWYPLRDDVGTPEFRRQTVSRALQYIGTPYAYEDIAKLLFGRVLVDIKHLFCSEAVQLDYLGETAIGKKALTPNEMASLEIFKAPVLIFDSEDNNAE